MHRLLFCLKRVNLCVAVLHGCCRNACCGVGTSKFGLQSTIKSKYTSFEGFIRHCCSTISARELVTDKRNHTSTAIFSKISDFCDFIKGKTLESQINIYYNSIPVLSGYYQRDIMSEYSFFVEYAKRGQASCKKCKGKCEKGVLRIGKIVPNPFSSSGGDMKMWYHVNCIFETFLRARATTKKIEEPGDLSGWEDIEDEDKQMLLNHMKDLPVKSPQKTTPKKSPGITKEDSDAIGAPTPASASSLGASEDSTPLVKKRRPTCDESDPNHKDNSFREFRRVCAKIFEVSSYNAKTSVVEEFFEKGSDGNGFKGDLYLWVHSLLPGVIKKIYNLQSKQLIKLFSQIFHTDQEEMLTDLEQGDVAETVSVFFQQSDRCQPIKKSTLTLIEVDAMLEELSKLTREEDQYQLLMKITKMSTANDLKMVIRLIKHDLRINCGAKHILDAVHPDAYEAFQSSRDIDNVISRVLEQKMRGPASFKKALSIHISLMTPVLPMLANVCKSVEQAFKKCPNGFYAEIKYDGERVQLHKHGEEFRYFSRSLKPVLPHKVVHFKEYIPQAFPHGKNLILDAEVLLIDNKTGQPLPFGTLGKHKKTAFQDANVCLFIFDCLHFNGENLMDRPIQDRRQTLLENMTEVPNRILFSEMKHITKKEQLQDMITRVFKQGLEGLVLKDVKSIYEPGKRHWLKVKKDYLHEGAMADTADLVVLGAWYGTGNKGGIMSVFLMGCYDPVRDVWCTVTKVHTGHDDSTLKRLQNELAACMTKISKDPSRVPSWLRCTKTMIPDFVASDPKLSPIWEITGAEFTKAEIHTADGISIRFPRVTKIRDDKTWSTATNLQELKALYKASKETTDLLDVIPEENSGSVESGRESSSSGQSHSSTPSKGQLVEVQTAKKRKTHEMTFENMDPEDKSSKKKWKQEDSTTAGITENKHPTSNPLPDVFTGVKLMLKKTLADYKDLKRYFLAFDGELLQDYQISEATHVIYDNDENSEEVKAIAAIHVTVDWLWDSIKLKKLQPAVAYKVV